MFFVVSGYLSPDCYTSRDGPVLSLSMFKTADEVEKFHREFLENAAGPETSHRIFRVIEGKELSMVPVESVVTYKLLGR